MVFTISVWRTNLSWMFCTADWTTWTSKWRNSSGFMRLYSHDGHFRGHTNSNPSIWVKVSLEYRHKLRVQNNPQKHEICHSFHVTGLGDSNYGSIAVSRLGKSFLCRQAIAWKIRWMDSQSSNEWRQFQRPWRLLSLLNWDWYEHYYKMNNTYNNIYAILCCLNF